jgi:hypothetical protein
MFDEHLALAIVGYEAYGDKANWKNYQGLKMPSFAELPDNIKIYWIAAAQAIAVQYAQYHPNSESDESTD